MCIRDRNYFQPMYDYFHRELLKRSFAIADETRVQVLNEEGRRAQTQSFMWLFRSGEDGLPAIILYGYSPTRSGSHAREFLEGYSGYLETDGYQGYNNLRGIRRCSCCCLLYTSVTEVYKKIPAFNRINCLDEEIEKFQQKVLT